MVNQTPPYPYLIAKSDLMLKFFKISPVAKPRMTRRDVWAKRKVVIRYREFCDELRSQAEGWELPDAFRARFIVPMPSSWCKKKRLQKVATPHQQRPDADNLCKALMDALLKEDSTVWKLEIEKIWGEEGAIIIDDLRDN